MSSVSAGFRHSWSTKTASLMKERHRGELVGGKGLGEKPVAVDGDRKSQGMLFHQTFEILGLFQPGIRKSEHREELSEPWG